MLGKVVYWLAVVAISLALVIALVLWLESRDESRVETPSSALPALSRA